MLRVTTVLILFFCAAGLAEVQNTADNTEWKQSLKTDPERQLKIPRTLVYSRAQFKYNSQLNYIGRWVDTPLLVDPELGSEQATARLSLENFSRMQETVLSYGMDGFACLPGKMGSEYLYNHCAKTQMKNFTLIPELWGGGYKFSPDNTMENVILPSLNSPYSLRIDGKLLVSSYGTPVSMKEWKKLFDFYREKYGDKFIFLPQVGDAGGNNWPNWLGKYRSGKITIDDVNKIKDSFREILRNTDGLYLTAWAIEVAGERRFDTEFYRDFMIAIAKKVLSEPEFKDKYFALTARIGHENATRIGHNLNCYGTATLRDSMETAIAAKADIIIIPEWDEQNENTSLRPTVYNSFSSKRIMRYYMGRLKNETLTSVENDDLSIPNIIISHRKTLTAGERINIELLNVPDSDKKIAYSVTLSLNDINGKELIKFPSVEFNSAEMKEHRFFAPSENYASHQVLLPKLAINYLGKDIVIEDGFQYLELRGSWNWDYKWVKEPIRDMLKPLRNQFKLTGFKNNIADFSVNFSAAEKLSYVELLDQNSVVYTAQRSGEYIWRETAEHKVLAFHMQNMPNHKTTLNGSISIKGDGIKWLTDNSYSWPTNYPTVINGNAYSFKNTELGLAARKFYVSIPASLAEDAVVEIALPGNFVQSIPVKQILENGIYGVPGDGTASFTISRFMRQAFHPKRLNAESASFSAGVIPDMPRSIIHLQAIGESGKIYRSKPVIVLKDNTYGKPGTLIVYSDTRKAPVSITAPAWQIPDIVYNPDKKTGTVLTCPAGRMFWGIEGGYAAQATVRGGSENRDTSAFISMSSYPKEAVKSSPAVIEKDGKSCWSFDGLGTHLAFPSGVIPRRSAFTLSFDLFPENVASKQIIISNRSHTLGSLELFMEGSKLRGTFLDNDGNHRKLDSGITVSENKWSSIKIVYDLSNIIFFVNDKNSGKIACPGPGRNDTTTVVGGYDKEWFKGLIRNIEIKHTADVQE